ncbi:MAG TPA: hypothetical protein ENN67_02780 [Firmicutes bacterium]|nr:hypothetical protein [Bacillota bacterium]
MKIPPDETERKQCIAFADQILNEAAESQAMEILFRSEKDRVQTFLLIDGNYEKSLAIPMPYWETILEILTTDYFETGQYQVHFQDTLCIYEWREDPTGLIRIKIQRKPAPGRRTDRIEDIFRAFEDRSWDAIKSIFLSILNLALEQKYTAIKLELFGQIVEIRYFRNGESGTSMTISSDSYDALTRLIGENYFAFGFMTREFREKEYLIRLTELNEDEVAPRIRLEIEELL